MAFVLDPDAGTVKIEPHWWFHDARALNAFLEEGIYRSEQVIGSDAKTIEYGYAVRDPLNKCQIGVRIASARQSATAQAETLAEDWLTTALSERSFAKKSDYLYLAQTQFPRLSKRGFFRVWDSVTSCPEHQWIKKPGPK